VRGVHADDVHACADERLDAGLPIGADADRGPHEQPTLGVLGGVRVGLGLLEILDGDEPPEAAVLAGHEQLLDAVLVQERLARLEVGALPHGHEVRRHDRMDRAREALLEADVPPRQDAHRLAVPHHGESVDAVLPHQGHGVGEGLVRIHGDGVDDHARLGPLHPLDLPGLVLRGEVLVNEAEAAAAGHRDRELGTRDRVHRGADERNVQRQPARQARPGIDLVGQDVREGGKEQHVVEGQRVTDDARRARGETMLRHGRLLRARKGRRAPGESGGAAARGEYSAVCSRASRAAWE
jgi:hypothetical protein